jgi:hypothetical protein
LYLSKLVKDFLYMPRVIGTLTGHHVDAPFVIHHLWSIIGDSDGVVSFILPSALALLSFHMSTGKLGSRPLGKKAVARGAVELPPGAAAGMAIGAQVPQPQPAAIVTIGMGTKMH